MARTTLLHMRSWRDELVASFRRDLAVQRALEDAEQAVAAAIVAAMAHALGAAKAAGARVHEALLEHEDRLAECVICFQSTPESERSVLHGVHWVCIVCRSDMRLHGIAHCPMCRESVPDTGE